MKLDSPVERLANELGDALRIATSTATGDRWRHRARNLSERMKTENGVDDAVRYVFRDLPSARLNQQSYFKARRHASQNSTKA